MPKQKLTVLLAVCLLTLGCAQRDPLTRTFAASAISASPTFKTPQQFFLHTGVMSNKDYMAPEYLVLQRRGWITGATVPCTADVAPPPCYDVALTPIGVETFRDLIPADAKARQYLPISTARRQLVSVTGVSRADNLADVDFTWHWVPMNEVGAALVATGVTFQSTVGFKLYDDGWRVIEGTATKSNQNMDDAVKDAQPQQ
jgi:hypothetical protein